MAVARSKKKNRVPFTPAGNRYKKGEFRMPSLRFLGPVVGWSLAVVLALAVTAGISFVLLYGYRWITEHPYFALEEVKIEGIERLTYARALDAAGVSPGENTLGLNMRSIQAGLSANPWVKEVIVKRVLPDRLEIKIIERTPTFWVREKDELYYSDMEGNIIAPVKADGGGFVSLPQLIVDTGAETFASELPEYLNGLKANNIPVTLEEAAWIRLSAGPEIELFIDREDRLISLELKRFDLQCKRFLAVLEDLEKRGELQKARSIAARGENVWVAGI